MKVTTLECIEPLLAVDRGGDFIHFHATPDGIVADVRPARGQVRLPLSTAARQPALLGRIEDVPAALESHASGERSTQRQWRVPPG